MTVKDIVIQNLQRQRKLGKFCDVKLILGKYTTFVHSAVICPLSLFIRKTFLNSRSIKSKHKTTPSSQCLVKIKLNGIVLNKCTDCLGGLIDFIYGKNISISSTHAAHIEHLFECLNLPDYIIKLIKEKNKINIHEQILQVNLPIVEAGKTFPITSAECIKSELDELSSQEFNADMELEQNTQDSSVEYSTDSKNIINKVDINTKLPTGKTHNCIECDVKYYKSHDLLNHLLQTSHGNAVCSLCWTDVEDSNKLIEHIQLHNHPKPFFCDCCSSRFRTRSLLAQHLPSHTVQRPFSCEICYKSFKSKHSLNCHSVSHSNEKKHLCDECGFSTVHSRMLRAHKLIHSGKLFKCPIAGCHQTSTIKQNMEQHINTHDKNQLFVCELCGHKFTQSKSLKRHSMIHTDEEGSNTCSYCPFKARRMDNLKAHILRQHAEKSHKFKPNCQIDRICIPTSLSNILSN